MPRKSFKVTLKKPDGMNSAYFIVPFDVQKVYGTKAQVKVKGTLDGYPYRGSIVPMGGGVHVMGLRKEIRDAIGKSAGDTVKVVMEIDSEPRIMEIPSDFKKALNKNKKIKVTFDKLSYSHRKEYVMWIESAKKIDTRIRRITKAIEKLSEQ